MLKLFGDTVLIRPDAVVESVSRGGIILQKRMKKRSLSGVVLTKGPGLTRADGSLQPSGILQDVQVGDRVIYNKYSQLDVEHDGEMLELLDAEDLLAIVETDEEIYTLKGVRM